MTNSSEHVRTEAMTEYLKQQLAEQLRLNGIDHVRIEGYERQIAQRRADIAERQAIIEHLKSQLDPADVDATVAAQPRGVSVNQLLDRAWAGKP